MFLWAQQLRGKYICIEGPDGVGKTTLTRALMQQLQDFELDVLVVREPGATKLGEAVRAILLDEATANPKRTGSTDGQAHSLLTQFYLFAAAREHLKQHVIDPAKAAGKVVISDRGAMSSYVYQGVDADFNHLMRHRADIQLLLMAGDNEIERRLAIKRESLSQFDDTREKRQAFRDVYRKAIDFEPYVTAAVVTVACSEAVSLSNILSVLKAEVSRLS